MAVGKWQPQELDQGDAARPWPHRAQPLRVVAPKEVRPHTYLEDSLCLSQTDVG